MDSGFLISFAIDLPATAVRRLFRTTFRRELIPLLLLSSARDRFYAPHADTTAAALEGDLMQAEYEIHTGSYSRRQGVSLMMRDWTSTLSLWRVYP